MGRLYLHVLTCKFSEPRRYFLGARVRGGEKGLRRITEIPEKASASPTMTLFQSLPLGSNLMVRKPMQGIEVEIELLALKNEDGKSESCEKSLLSVPPVLLGRGVNGEGKEEHHTTYLRVKFAEFGEVSLSAVYAPGFREECVASSDDRRLVLRSPFSAAIECLSLPRQLVQNVCEISLNSVKSLLEESSSEEAASVFLKSKILQIPLNGDENLDIKCRVKDGVDSRAILFPDIAFNVTNCSFPRQSLLNFTSDREGKEHSMLLSLCPRITEEQAKTISSADTIVLKLSFAGVRGFGKSDADPSTHRQIVMLAFLCSNMISYKTRILASHGEYAEFPAMRVRLNSVSAKGSVKSAWVGEENCKLPLWCFDKTNALPSTARLTRPISISDNGSGPGRVDDILYLCAPRSSVSDEKTKVVIEIFSIRQNDSSGVKGVNYDFCGFCEADWNIEGSFSINVFDTMGLENSNREVVIGELKKLAASDRGKSNLKIDTDEYMSNERKTDNHQKSKSGIDEGIIKELFVKLDQLGEGNKSSEAAMIKELKSRVEDLRNDAARAKEQLEKAKREREQMAARIFQLRKEVGFAQREAKLLREQSLPTPESAEDDKRLKEHIAMADLGQLRNITRSLNTSLKHERKKIKQVEKKAAEYLLKAKKGDLKSARYRRLENAHQQQTAILQTLQAKNAAYKKKLKAFDVDKYAKTIRNQEKIISKLESMLEKAYGADNSKDQSKYIKAIEKLTKENQDLRSQVIDFSTKVALLESKLPSEVVEGLLTKSRKETLALRIEKLKDGQMTLEQDGVKMIVDDKKVQELTERLKKSQMTNKSLQQELEAARKFAQDKVLKNQSFVDELENTKRKQHDVILQLRNELASTKLTSGVSDVKRNPGGPSQGQSDTSQDSDYNVWRFRYASLETKYNTVQQKLMDSTREFTKKISRLKIQLQKAKIQAQTGLKMDL